MKVYFVEPPAAKRIGGLDAAIRPLETALRDLGLNVSNQSAQQAVRGDLVHFHALWEPSHAHLSRTLSRRGVAMIVSPHGMLEPWAWHHRWWKKWPYYWLIERQHLHRANALLATAPPEAQRLTHFLPTKRVATIPLGLAEETITENYADARRSLGWSPDETILLYLSRLHSKKGLDLLLHALSTIALPPRVRLVVVGGGEPQYLAQLHAVAERLRDQLPRIDWIGEVWGSNSLAIFSRSGPVLPSYALGELRPRRTGIMPRRNTCAHHNDDAVESMVGQ